MSKNLEDLPTDVENLFDPELDHQVSEEFLDEFASDLKDILRTRLSRQPARDGKVIRFSSLGKADRQLWMDAHPDPENEETMSNQTYLKFLYGDFIEALFLYLAKEAGHDVKDQQKEIEVDGIKGHIDAIIDGVLVDVKSASMYGYKKFENDTVEQDDAFGYVEQLAGYATVLTPGKDAGWWAVDKVTGSTCIASLKAKVIEHYDPKPRIDHLKQVVASDTPPELCHQPIADGKSGNMKLPTPCSYCKHKYRCHPDARMFIYSNGPRWLTTVARVPDVLEIKR